MKKMIHLSLHSVNSYLKKIPKYLITVELRILALFKSFSLYVLYKFSASATMITGKMTNS